MRSTASGHVRSTASGHVRSTASGLMRYTAREQEEPWLCVFQRMSFIGEFGCHLETDAPLSVDEFEQHLGVEQELLGIPRSSTPQVVEHRAARRACAGE